MSYSRKEPIANQSVRIGVHHNWVYEEPLVIGEQRAVLRQFEGSNFSKSHRRINGVYKSGGSWVMHKTERVSSPSGDVKIFRPGYGIAYTGACVGDTFVDPRANVSLDPTLEAQTQFEDLKLRGAEAFNKLRTDLPDFTLAVSVYELKDAVPLLKGAVSSVRRDMQAKLSKQGRRESELSRAGSHYLGAQFGWIPLLKDIQKFNQALKTKDARLRQLIRDSEKPIRRRRRMSDNLDFSSNTSEILGRDYFPMQPLLVTQCYPDNEGTREINISRAGKTWCEGVSSYMLPPGPRDLNWKKMMSRRIMGGIVSPRELYELMPWSWLIDYFSDLGQFISAISPGVADRHYMSYAYLMRSTISQSVTTVSDKVITGMDSRSETVTSTNTQRFTIKTRVPASPFGWGVKDGDLTLSQSAILGALGLSRLP